MNGRELFTALFAGEQTDRLPIKGIGAWGEAYERWRGEGMPDGVDLNVLLGLTEDDALWLPLNLNMVPTFPIDVLEVGAEYVTLVDEYGVKKLILRSDYDRSGGYKGAAGAMSSMAYWLDFPVKDLRSWKTILEARFQPTLDGRWPEDWAARRDEFVRQAETRWVKFFCFPLCGLFGPLRELMGLEGLLFAMADDPALVHTIIDDLTDYWLAAFAAVVREVRVDQVMFFEDMCATRAPLIGPAMFREFLSPGYRKVVGGLRELGVQQFLIDTDGNAWELIPEMIACGLTGMSPCEVQSDMDVERLRTAFPTFFLNGGVDKHALVEGPAAIDAELERRFATARRHGRYTPQLDHGAPPDISWANVQHYAQRYRELALAPVRV